MRLCERNWRHTRRAFPFVTMGVDGFLGGIVKLDGYLWDRRELLRWRYGTRVLYSCAGGVCCRCCHIFFSLGDDSPFSMVSLRWMDRIRVRVLWMDICWLFVCLWGSWLSVLPYLGSHCCMPPDWRLAWCTWSVSAEKYNAILAT